MDDNFILDKIKHLQELSKKAISNADYKSSAEFEKVIFAYINLLEKREPQR